MTTNWLRSVRILFLVHCFCSRQLLIYNIWLYAAVAECLPPLAPSSSSVAFQSSTNCLIDSPLFDAMCIYNIVTEGEEEYPVNIVIPPTCHHIERLVFVGIEVKTGRTAVG